MSAPRPDGGPSAARPPVLDAVGRAYADARAALSAMPDIMLVGLIASCVYAVADIVLGWALDPGLSSGALVLGTLLTLVWNFYLTPIFVAIHRFVVRGEITPRYTLRPGEARFRNYFGWTAALTLASMLPALIGLRAGASVVANTVALVLMILFLVASVRLLILFPAIALDAPGASWPNAFADSQGRFWRIFAILLLAILPLLVGGMLLSALVGADSALGKVGWSMVGFLAGTLSAAIASRLYMALARRLQAGAPI